MTEPTEPIRKRVDESWKEQVEREKHTGAKPPGAGPAAAPSSPAAQPAPAKEEPPHGESDEMPQARFDLFLQGLVMEALIALGEMPNPATRKQTLNLAQARYLIDLLGLLEEKTRGNLAVDEERLLKDAVYQLRMRYLSRAGAPPS